MDKSLGGIVAEEEAAVSQEVSGETVDEDQVDE